MANTHIISFIKFGSENDIMDLYHNGTIYCNTIEYFRLREDNEGRGDPNEGLSLLYNYQKDAQVVLKIEDKNIQIHPINFQVRGRSNDTGNLYCLWALTREELIDLGSYSVNILNKKLGSHFILIKDCKEFYKRIKQGFADNQLNIETGFVNYYQKDKYFGEVSLFQKSDEFSHQKEFRIVIENRTNDVVKFSIGGLEEIAEVFTTDILDELKYIFD
jgi:hypothetical protein